MAPALNLSYVASIKTFLPMALFVRGILDNEYEFIPRLIGKYLELVVDVFVENELVGLSWLIGLCLNLNTGKVSVTFDSPRCFIFPKAGKVLRKLFLFPFL